MRAKPKVRKPKIRKTKIRKTKIYLAGPLFTLAEQTFNAALARFLESKGFAVWLPQEHEPRRNTAQAIFRMDVAALDWADMVVACMDGPDPDSGTAWECGYAYAQRQADRLLPHRFSHFRRYQGRAV